MKKLRSLKEDVNGGLINGEFRLVVLSHNFKSEQVSLTF